MGRATRSLQKLLRASEDRVAAWLGVTPAQRVVIVRGMVEPRSGSAMGYWLQLGIATLLATLGLALDSTAVVIGAMLIAPLMKPIVELSMGLGTGSAPLTLRAGARTAWSVGLVVLGAALITKTLPFHEPTRELLARTAPSLIDLFVAAACALAAGYATMCSASDVASTAAGTSIGISLVPPLCTAGYGLATGDNVMASGAALLFTANITGILGVASLAFVVAGFGQVDVGEEEKALDDASRQGVAVYLGRRWSRHAASRLGFSARLVLPLALFAAIYLPLRRAVGDMAQRAEVRREVGAILADDSRRVVQSSLDITAKEVVVRAIVVGDADAALDTERLLRERLAELGVASPKVSVWAVPDASEVSSLADRLGAIPIPAPVRPPEEVSRELADRLGSAVRDAWPAGSAGELIATWVDFGDTTRIRVVHLGAPLGDTGRALLARAVSTTEALVVDEEALQPVTAAPADPLAWLGPALRLADQVAMTQGVRLCVTVPAPPPRDRRGRVV
ncbi:MAG: DUF389 domain-containing protein, partial [Myxococcales bacterium]|nr:DUF389 domain-containing protein [Myxococcales bacterium]